MDRSHGPAQPGPGIGGVTYLPPSGASLHAAVASSPLVASLLSACRFPAGTGALTCAVSGGADSTALAVLAVAAGFEVTLIHVDHGLRDGSANEAPLVADLAERLGAAFVSERVDVGHGPNLEERAREARYAALPTDVCTGHTADDLAETVMLHLLRGAGLDGVASMARSQPGGVQRPLLGLRRRDTEALCASLDLATVSDLMNADERFRRVRVRREVLPLLNDVAGRDAVGLLARHAEIVADDVALLEALSERVDPTAPWGMRDVPAALARRAVRRWLRDAGVGHGRVVSASSVDRVLAVAAGDAVACEIEGGWRVARTNGVLRAVPPTETNE